jgi:hypothetical protein
MIDHREYFMNTDISQMLDKLANFYAQRDVLNLEKQELIDQVLTPEIKARIAEIEAEFAGRREAVDANIAALEDEIRKEVVERGEAIKGTFLRVIWIKGRVTWDTKSLDIYARTHPEVLRYRKQGEPFTRIEHL